QTDTFNEKQTGVTNFKKKLTLREWVGDSIYINLTKWFKEFRLFQGLIINKHLELKNCKKIAIDFINIPYVNSSDESYLEITKPTSNIEEFLISNNIYLDKPFLSIKKDSNCGNKCYLEIIKPTTDLEEPFPVIKKTVIFEDLNYEDCTYFLVKYQRHKISLTKDDIKPSKNFIEDIEEALENMKPF